MPSPAWHGECILEEGRIITEGWRVEEKSGTGWRAWIVAILAAAFLSAGATLLLGDVFRAASPSASAPIDGGCGCPTEGK
jgi:hypothetical protein